MITRNLGINMSGNAIKRLTGDDAEELFKDPCLVPVATNNISVMKFLKELIIIRSVP